MIEGESINLTDDDCTSMETIGWSSNRKRKKKTKPEYIETIVIDDESLSQRSSQGNIIEVSDSENTIDRNKKAVDSQMNELYRENKLMATLIEECFNIENSRDMADILNKNILKTYNELDRKYKSSEEFQRVLTKALERLSVDPDYKFTHINNLWETMRFHCKKRVELVTLATNLKDVKSVKRNAAFSPRPSKRRKSVNNIESDDEENSIVINLDDDFDNDVVLLDQTEQVDEEKENKSSKNKRKEKKKESKADEVQQTVNKEQNNYSQNVLLQEPDIKETQTTEKAEDKTIKYLGSNNSSEIGFLVPLSEVYCDPNSIPNTSEPVVEEQFEKPLDMLKIKTIEQLIEHYKSMIVKLEQQEVNNDTMSSPYVVCEKYKEKIVQLYTELCQLTGDAPVKRRSVRLTVLEGHPPGPVRRLEEFINSNIGSNGDPPFPDFCDVVKCVQTANDEDGLGWSKNKIIREAQAIFTHCGRALQKRRQRRLYRDLASLVDEAAADPADEDPALLARLEKNKRVAEHKERQILEKFTRLQNVPTQPAPSTTVVNETPKPTQSNEESDYSDFDISDTVRSDNVISEVSQNNENYILGYENNNVSANCNVEVEETKVQIKKEPGIDLVKRLEEFGDNFTISIIDIQDPFLTIEISSDSSSDEG